MGAQLADRWRLTLPLLLPVLGGLAYLYGFGAPSRLIAINAGALVLALGWVLFGRVSEAPKVRLVIAVALALGLFVPLVTGPNLGGVARWILAGPVVLHSGAFLLPLLVVLAASDVRRGPLLLGVATAALALQPDAATLLALALASTVLAISARSLLFALVGATAAALCALTFGAGSLAPQLYTEGVLAHVAWQSVAVAVALGLLLFVGPSWHWVGPKEVPGSEGHALAALLIGFGFMAMIGPFPFPLIGYGASPILGFGLALGGVAARREAGFREPR